MKPGQPILRRMYHTELVERLSKMIYSGERAAGSIIPEKGLCERIKHLSNAGENPDQGQAGPGFFKKHH